MGIHLKKFSTHAEYNVYINSSSAILPNVSICTIEEDVHYNQLIQPQALTLTCVYVPTSSWSSTQLFYNTSFINSIESMKIDDIEQSSIVNTYDFGDTNIHIVTLRLKDDVTSISDYAFYDCSGLISCIIGNGVTSIDDYAFYCCSSLTSCTISSGVTSINDYAFGYCSSLTSIDIPDSVTTIGYRAFEGCSSLTSITVDVNNINYSSENGVLFNKTKTTLIKCPIGNTRTFYDIPSGVTSIDNDAFRSCSGLTSIDIPDSVTSIGNDVFSYCNGLTSIDIPSGVTSIGNSAFKNCTGLTNIDIPSGVTSIVQSAFEGCSSLTSITVDVNNTNYSSENGILFDKDKTTLIQYPSGNTRTYYDVPSGVTSIGANAFEYCIGLTSINIPDSVTSIVQSAFEGCSSLTSITVDVNNTSYSSENGILFDKDKTTLILYPSGNTRTYYDVPSGVTSIARYAFKYCISLTSIDIPDSVTSIGTSVFEGCSGLTNITVDVNNTNYSSENGVLFDKAKTKLILYPSGNTRTSYDIPRGVTSISRYAFSGCSSLTSITVDVNNTSYSSENGILFDKAKTKLIQYSIGNTRTSYNIPNGVTSIGNDAFSGCSNLTSINIPSGVTSIGHSAFRDCSGLTSIDIPDSVTSINNQGFYGCSGLTSIDIPSGVTSIGNYAFKECSNLTSITIEATTPPILGTSVFALTDNCPIHVPSASVETYKLASGWSNYASRIQAIQ